MAGQQNPFQKQAPTGLQTFLSQTQYLQGQKKPEEKLGSGLLGEAANEAQALQKRTEKIGENTQETQKIGSQFQPAEYKAPTIAQPNVETNLLTGKSFGTFGTGAVTTAAPSSESKDIIQGIVKEGSVDKAPTMSDLQTNAANKITEYQQGAKQQVQDYSANVGKEISNTATAAQSSLDAQYGLSQDALQKAIAASQNIGQTGQLSGTEQQAQALQSILRQYGTSNIEALSALLGGRQLTPEEQALTSQVYQGDIQNLRGQAEKQSIEAERIKSMRDFLQSQMGQQQTATGTELAEKKTAGTQQISKERARAENQAQADANALSKHIEDTVGTLKGVSKEQLHGFEIQIANSAIDQIKNDIAKLKPITDRNLSLTGDDLEGIKTIQSYMNKLADSLLAKGYGWAAENLKAEAGPIIQMALDQKSAELAAAKTSYLDRSNVKGIKTPPDASGLSTLISPPGGLGKSDEYINKLGTAAGIQDSSPYIREFLSHGLPKSADDRPEQQDLVAKSLGDDFIRKLPDLNFSYDAKERTRLMDDSKAVWESINTAADNLKKYGMGRAAEQLIQGPLKQAYEAWQQASDMANNPWRYQNIKPRGKIGL